MYYAEAMRALHLVLIVLVLMVPLTSLTAQTAAADSVVSMAENLGDTAGRLLQGAPALLGDQRSWTISVGEVLWDGQTPRSADLMTAIIADGLLDAAARLAGSLDLQVLGGGPSQLVVTARGSGGADSGMFVVQLLEDQGAQGRIVASGRVRVVLNDEVRAALAPAGGTAGTASVGAAVDVSDDPADAQPIAVGGSVTDQELEVSGDEDWYVVDAPRRSVDGDAQPALEIYTRGPTDTYLEFYGPDSPTSLIAENDDSDGTNAGLTALVEGGRRYWIKVRGFANSSTGPYELYVEEAVVELDDLEPNNSLEQATRIDVGMLPLSASIRPGSDSDWYILTEELLAAVGGGGPDVVLALGTRSEIDTVIEVVDAEGFQLAYSDDDGEGANARAILPDGTGPFYVEVRGFGSWNEGPYELVLEAQQIVRDEWEPDDSREAASVISPGDPERSYTFSTSSDVDWLRFVVPEGGAMRILAETGGDVDTFLRLYDEDGTELETDDDSGDGFNARLSEFLGPGTYFIEISPLYLGPEDGPYRFRLQQQ